MGAEDTLVLRLGKVMPEALLGVPPAAQCLQCDHVGTGSVIENNTGYTERVVVLLSTEVALVPSCEEIYRALVVG